MALTLHLSQFDGPLDMLIFLIGKAKINIRDIFVSEVTDQYIQSVQNAPDLDMDDASAFISMAATLLEIKSRALLPKPQVEEEEDPEQALIRQLEEYQRFKQIAQDMQGFEKAAALMYQKLPEEYPLPPPTLELTGLTMDGLLAAFARVMARIKDDPEEPIQTARRIVRDEYTVPRCTAHILRRLKKGPVHFEELFSEAPSRDEVVTLFLALLELLRLGRAGVSQDGIFGDIVLEPREGENLTEGELTVDGYA
ncbi:MAG: segregation/condensation protein A [Clostridia bacterium]|nr:chromosome segregation protein ScpA [Clostridiales bacterium]MBQ2978347.1 segregation/condensation protein A [Clostridia bacterium]MBQ6803489.1 segregation/condensation protein A [Clostridia bacterium]